jgi:hypothetical protein
MLQQGFRATEMNRNALQDAVCGHGAPTRTYFARQLVAIRLCYVLIGSNGRQGAQDVALQLQRYCNAIMG